MKNILVNQPYTLINGRIILNIDLNFNGKLGFTYFKNLKFKYLIGELSIINLILNSKTFLGF